MEFDPRPGAVLKVRDLSISFSGLRALDRVSLDVPARGVTAVIGPNGAGKTTLLNCVSGIYRHDGEVLLDGAALGHASADERCRRGITRTFQTPALLDDLPALDNVMLGAHTIGRGFLSARANRLRENEIRERSRSVLSALGAVGLAERLAGDLAHGDRRRVETARALVSSPRVLLLDEPAAGLDDDEAHELVSAAAQLADSTVLVEHNMQLVMTVARHVVVLAFGEVLAAGTPHEVSNDPRVIEAYLGDGVA